MIILDFFFVFTDQTKEITKKKKSIYLDIKFEAEQQSHKKKNTDDSDSDASLAASFHFFLSQQEKVKVKKGNEKILLFDFTPVFLGRLVTRKLQVLSKLSKKRFES